MRRFQAGPLVITLNTWIHLPPNTANPSDGALEPTARDVDTVGGTGLNTKLCSDPDAYVLSERRRKLPNFSMSVISQAKCINVSKELFPELDEGRRCLSLRQGVHTPTAVWGM